MKRTKRPKIPKPPLQPLQPGQSMTPSVSADHERLVGRVVIEWAKLEGVLLDLIWQLLNLDDEDGRTVLARSDADTRIKLIRALAPRYIEQPKLETILSAIDIADDLRDDRNFIIHGTWGTLMPENVPNAISIRTKSQPGILISETFSADRMNSIIKLTVETKSKLIKIIQELSPGIMERK